MQILLIGHVLIRDDVWIISLISFGKFIVSESVGNHKSESQDQDDDDLIALSEPAFQRLYRLTSAIRDIMQTITPVV